MKQEIVRYVWDRARNRCEYCHITYPQYRLPFQIDHIRARQHGGETTIENLALACFHCNRHKGPNIAGWDLQTDQLHRLFHPRTDSWNEHFSWDVAEIVGRSICGRVTVQVLAMNAQDLVMLRIELQREGVSLY